MRMGDVVQNAISSFVQFVKTMCLIVLGNVMSKSFQFTPEQQELYNACTKLQQNVVINMIAGGMSQRKAYKKAGGKAKNDGVADKSVSRMLSMGKVKAFYDSLKVVEAGDAIMSREESLKILTDMARTTITDVIDINNIEIDDKDGKPVQRANWAFKEVDDISEASRRSIQELTAGNDGMKIKMHNQANAIKQLAIMQGWDSASKHEHIVEIEDKAETSDRDLARKLAFLLTKGDLAD